MAPPQKNAGSSAADPDAELQARPLNKEIADLEKEAAVTWVALATKQEEVLRANDRKINALEKALDAKEKALAAKDQEIHELERALAGATNTPNASVRMADNPKI